MMFGFREPAGENFRIRDVLYFSHPMPYIKAHGFADLKFVQKIFPNSLMYNSEA